MAKGHGRRDKSAALIAKSRTSGAVRQRDGLFTATQKNAEDGHVGPGGTRINIKGK